ncbi:MAG: response regulator transcription factor [Bacilli bacterium]|jgi:two-component system response regulator protein GraR|nr:response regulator transcription factor [Bacilli bacterium]
MKKILIIEDDSSIRTELKELLNNSGYETIILTDFQNALDNILNIKADLILLDINIPYLNGEILLQNIRKFSNIPVIMVTSRNTEIDEVISMSYGADDYITKPYNPNILLLRISAVLKRAVKKEDTYSYRDLEINMNKGIIKGNNIEIILTKNEMIIFNYLLNNRNKIVTRDELMTDLWNNDEYINDNALSVNISRLRAKLKEAGYEDAIITRKGIGYILL